MKCSPLPMEFSGASLVQECTFFDESRAPIAFWKCEPTVNLQLENHSPPDLSTRLFRKKNASVLIHDMRLDEPFLLKNPPADESSYRVSRGVIEKYFQDFAGAGRSLPAPLRLAHHVSNAAVDWSRYAKVEDWQGEESPGFQNWMAAVNFVNADADGMPLGPELLQALHRRVARANFYAGFEKRRIKEAYQEGKIDVDTAVAAIVATKDNKAWTGTDHGNLTGQFRSEDLDHFTFTGEWFDKEGGRYFRENGFDGFRQNPFFKIQEDSVSRDDKGRIYAKVHYVLPKDVGLFVADVMRHSALALAGAQTDQEYVMQVLLLEKALMSIHPFQDGNGRTIRLLSDLLYIRRGIAVPTMTRIKQYVTPPETAYREVLRGMRAYLAYKSKEKMEPPRNFIADSAENTP